MRLKIIFNSIIILLVLVVTLSAAFAKEATPMSKDPEMEKIVNEISEELRCLVCQNQTIADSNAELAVDLKNQVRDMVASGKTQDEIVDYMVKRYGDFVRYRPPVKPETYLLWVGPFVLMVLGIIILVTNLRKRTKAIAETPLSEGESEKLDSILKSEDAKNDASSDKEGK